MGLRFGGQSIRRLSRMAIQKINTGNVRRNIQGAPAHGLNKN
jgi:hypothetical protein